MYTASISPMSGSISTGALLGTSGTSELVQSINDSLMSSATFNGVVDPFLDIRNNFINEVLRPIQLSRESINNRVMSLMNPDTIRLLQTAEDFTSIPPCMYEPIIMYAPVRELLKQGRIHGFGFDPDKLPEEDVWGRLISNGVCTDVLAYKDTNNEVQLTYEFYGDDPRPSFEELDMVEQTRESISRLLAETDYDITDYPNDRG